MQRNALQMSEMSLEYGKDIRGNLSRLWGGSQGRTACPFFALHSGVVYQVEPSALVLLDDRSHADLRQYI